MWLCIAKFRRVERQNVDDDVEPDDVEPDDVEPDDVEPEDIQPASEQPEDIEPADDLLDDAAEYRNKKRMSAKLFRYLMDADDAKQADLGLTVDPTLQEAWRSAGPGVKLDDLGDAVLHSLRDLLCGGSNYRQLLPANSALQTNRTVVVAVQPDMAYWAVLLVTWNRFGIIFSFHYIIILSLWLMMHA